MMLSGDPGALDPRDNDTVERAMRRYLLGFVIPLWTAAGSIDYVLHRRSKIEENAGVKEATLHVVGISLSALPVVAGLFLEVNAGVIALMSAGFATHLGMTIWDVSYASTRRTITPLEQHVHAALELVPFTALSMVLMLHRDQALALIGCGTATPDFRIASKRNPICSYGIAATIGAFTLFVAIPYAEEFVRCYRFARKRERREGGA